MLACTSLLSQCRAPRSIFVPGPAQGPVCPSSSRGPTITVTGNTNLTAESAKVDNPGANGVLTVSVDDDVTGTGLSFSCTTVNGAIVDSGSLATGNITSGTVTRTLKSYRFPVGSTPVTCTATDCNGNNASASVTVTVSDRTPPVINLAEGTSYTFEATNIDGYRFDYTTPSASDNTDQSVKTASCAPPPGTFAINTETPFHTVVCTVKDYAGNTAIATFTVKVRARGRTAYSVLRGRCTLVCLATPRASVPCSTQPGSALP
jgi:hypothetical protein